MLVMPESEPALPFADRMTAGEQLGRLVKSMDLTNATVFGLPRGGVPVAWAVARAIEAPLDVLPARKLGAPGNPELAIGALALGGETYLSNVAPQLAGEEWIRAEEARQAENLSASSSRFRGDELPPDVAGRTALVVDDGIATGATAIAAARALRQLGADRVVIATPVAPRETISVLMGEASDVACLACPEDFYAVGAWYLDFHQVSDDEVLEYLHQP